MSSIKTRQKIIEAAIHLYNVNGFVNTTTRDIASAIGISVGNLSYHFHTKEELVEAIYHQLDSERLALIKEVGNIPTISNLYTHIIPFLDIYRRYSFFHIDQLEIVRTYPTISELYKTDIKNQQKYIRAIINYLVGKGVYAKQTEATYSVMTETIWLIFNFWFVAKLINNKPTDNFVEDIQLKVWELSKPYLTEKGKRQYDAVEQYLRTNINH